MGPYSEPKYYGADYISRDERAQFLEWYEELRENILQYGALTLLNGRCQCTVAGMLCIQEFVFELGQNGHFSASYYNIVILQKGVPYDVSEI